MRPLYFYHWQEWQEFESLVVNVCQDVLGIATVTFADGKDGGRDGRFNGKATKYPSESAPWSGKIIIQSKHTKYYEDSISDASFESIINDEIKKIKELMTLSELDYYLVFTNRRGPANSVSNLRKKISEKTGLSSDKIDFITCETLNSWLSDRQNLVEKYQLLGQPLRFFDGDIKDIISVLGRNVDVISSITGTKVSRKASDYLEKEEKNKKNNLSEEYFIYIRQNSLEYFDEILQFLKDPRNQNSLVIYTNIASKLNHKAILERKNYGYFEEIINDIADELFRVEEQLRKNKKLLYVFLHFMYWNCDLGLV